LPNRSGLQRLHHEAGVAALVAHRPDGARAGRLHGLRNTLQADALKLVAQRLQSSLAVEGELPEDGLAPAALGEHDAAKEDPGQAARLSPRYRPRRGRWRQRCRRERRRRWSRRGLSDEESERGVQRHQSSTCHGRSVEGLENIQRFRRRRAVKPACSKSRSCASASVMPRSSITMKLAQSVRLHVWSVRWV